MPTLEVPEEECFIRLPEAGEICKNSGLTRAEMECLIYPCKENAGRPPLRHVEVKIPGKDAVILLRWEELHQWLMRRDPKRSYETPRAFHKWLMNYPSCHKDSVPSTVVMVTELFQAGEEPQFQRAIDEQNSMNRAVWVVYTRKGAAVGYKKKVR